MPGSDSEVSGRVAVITGASRGIGAELAERFSQRGLRLGLCSRTAPVLEDGPSVVAVQLDVTDAPAVGRFAASVIERFGRIDLWVNNAGVLEPILPLRDVDVEAFRRHLDVNLTGVFIGTRVFTQHVRDRDGHGVLINVSSGASSNPYPGWGPYCASKGAIDMLTKVVDLEERDSGLRAHAVAPGVVDTEMQAMIRASTEEVFPRVERFRQMKRDGAFNSGRYVADELLALAFDPAKRSDQVTIRLESEEPAQQKRS